MFQPQHKNTRKSCWKNKIAFSIWAGTTNLRERADTQAASTKNINFSQLKKKWRFSAIIVQSLHEAEDDENNKLVSPWREPYRVRSNLPAVVYRIAKPGDTTEISVHLGWMK